MKKPPNDESDTLRPEYDFDFSKAEIGKYYGRVKMKPTGLIKLEPDVEAVFPDSAAVNEALRSMIEVSRIADRLKIKPRRKAAKSAARS